MIKSVEVDHNRNVTITKIVNINLKLITCSIYFLSITQNEIGTLPRQSNCLLSLNTDSMGRVNMSEELLSARM
jgi:hypothetical protein